MRSLIAIFLIGCTPPASTPAAPSRAVLEVYTAADGTTRCVEVKDGVWHASPSCCPAGFSVAGFSAPAATAYEHSTESIKKFTYRHVICLQDLPAAPVAAP